MAFTALWLGALRLLQELGMRKAVEYRKHAEECRRMATGPMTEEQRSLLLTMSRTWEQLAEDREHQLIQKQRIAELEARAR
jgi:hypothetical protein